MLGLSIGNEPDSPSATKSRYIGRVLTEKEKRYFRRALDRLAADIKAAVSIKDGNKALGIRKQISELCEVFEQVEPTDDQEKSSSDGDSNKPGTNED